MKKFYLAVAILIAIPFSLLSKANLDKYASPVNSENFKTTVTKDFLLGSRNTIEPTKDLLPQMLGKYKIVDRTIGVYFNSLFSGTTPIVYEPISKTVFMIQTDRYTPTPPADTTRLTGAIYLYWSQDMGANWSKQTIFEKSGDVPVNASISVTNPANSNDPQKCKVLVYSRYFKYDAFQDSYVISGSLFLFPNGGGLTQTGFDEYPELGPLTRNQGFGQQWSFSQATSYTNGDNSYSYVWGTLSPATGNRYGSYGFGNVEITQDGVNSNYSTLPAGWDYTNFRATDDPTTSYNGPMNIDVDPNGNLYACVFNYFSDYVDDADRRPAVSKSTDNGKTWSAWDQFPYQLIEEYKAANGILALQPNSFIFPNGSPASYGFAATGNDEYSFIFTAAKATVNAAELDQVGLIEVYKKNNTWHIRDVATANAYYCPFIVNDTTGTNDATVVDGFDLDPRGFEIQLAKTADGQNLLLKYNDNRPDVAPLITPFNLVGAGMVDTINVSDVYVTYRDVADNNGWASVRNVTDDYWNNKVTWIPKIIPSLTEVPIIEHVTVRFTNTENVRVMAEYPYVIQNFIIDPGVRNEIVFASFDAINPTSIRDEALQRPDGVVGYPVSVDEQINTNILSFGIYPNPVEGNATITYNIEKTANVKIEVFNAMGQLVKTIRSYELENPGLSAMSFDSSDLSVGVYYITLTANGRRITEIMNVVR